MSVGMCDDITGEPGAGDDRGGVGAGGAGGAGLIESAGGGGGGGREEYKAIGAGACADKGAEEGGRGGPDLTAILALMRGVIGSTHINSPSAVVSKAII